MALATFYHPTLELTDNIVELSSTESSHAIKSRRLAEGTDIQLINGRGLLAQAHISATTKRVVTAQIQSIEEHKLTYSLTIATAIPKGDRQKTMVDMMSQLGVTQIVPLHCERSVTNYKANLQEKWQRYAIEACKQSQNPWLPTIASELSMQQILRQNKASTVYYADSNGQSISSLKNPLNNDITVLIGPEGGFTQTEIKLLDESGSPLSLGEYILRTELAGVIAASQIRLISY